MKKKITPTQIKIFVIVMITSVTVFFQNCSDVAFKSAENANNNLGNPAPTPVPPTPNPILKSALQSLNQPMVQVTNKVDVVFVTDTSGSLDPERSTVAANIYTFINQLPVGSDINLAVLLAHGSLSQHSGNLYVGSKDGGKLAVLNTLTHSNATVVAEMRAKLENPVEDNNSDGGEESMYSLNKLISPNGLATAQQQGFFRSDAALAVVFVADENDICAVDATGQPVAYILNDAEESAAYDRDCKNANLTAQDIYPKLSVLKAGLPLVIAGIVINSTKLSEVGGYLEILNLSKGIAVDLNGNIANGLKTIGEVTTSKLNLYTRFNISQPDITQCSQVVPSSVSVKVDGVSVSHAFNTSTCEISIQTSDAGQSGSLVEWYYDYYEN